LGGTNGGVVAGQFDECIAAGNREISSIMATDRTSTSLDLTEPRAEGVARVLISSEDIQQKIREIAAEIDEEYAGDSPLMICVLNGAVSFMADLMQATKIPLMIDFMAISSYGASTKSSGVVRILKDLNDEIEGRRIIIVEDIVDSGLTLQYLLDNLRRRNPKDIRVVALLKKDTPAAIPVQVDRIGFTIPDEFVVGYGLDYAGRYRNLPYVAVLDPRVYSIPETT
jgi:hypoxanthine phosphoribosyltransferase